MIRYRLPRGSWHRDCPRDPSCAAAGQSQPLRARAADGTRAARLPVRAEGERAPATAGCRAAGPVTRRRPDVEPLVARASKRSSSRLWPSMRAARASTWPASAGAAARVIAVTRIQGEQQADVRMPTRIGVDPQRRAASMRPRSARCWPPALAGSGLVARQGLRRRSVSRRDGRRGRAVRCRQSAHRGRNPRPGGGGKRRAARTEGDAAARDPAIGIQLEVAADPRLAAGSIAARAAGIQRTRVSTLASAKGALRRLAEVVQLAGGDSRCAGRCRARGPVGGIDVGDVVAGEPGDLRPSGYFLHGRGSARARPRKRCSATVTSSTGNPRANRGEPARRDAAPHRPGRRLRSQPRCQTSSGVSRRAKRNASRRRACRRSSPAASADRGDRPGCAGTVNRRARRRRHRVAAADGDRPRGLPPTPNRNVAASSSRAPSRVARNGRRRSSAPPLSTRRAPAQTQIGRPPFSSSAMMPRQSWPHRDRPPGPACPPSRSSPSARRNCRCRPSSRRWRAIAGRPSSTPSRNNMLADGHLDAVQGRARRQDLQRAPRSCLVKRNSPARSNHRRRRHAGGAASRGDALKRSGQPPSPAGGNCISHPPARSWR